MLGWEAFPLSSPTGATLNVYHLAPKGEPKAVVQINHGMAEHAARYERFAGALAERGYATIAHDHRGHGHTTSRDAPLGVFSDKDGWTKVIADVTAVTAHAQTAHPALPLVCFGHSMGAVVAINHVLENPVPVAATALWNFTFDTGLAYRVFRGVLAAERMFKGADATSMLAQKMTFEAWNAKFKPNRTAFDWLSRDRTEVDRYVADPLCGFPVSIGAWLGVLGGMAAASQQALAQLPADMPFHLAGGGADPCSNHGRAVTALALRLRAAGIEDIKVEIRPDRRHESLNESDRDMTMDNFADWLDARFG